MSHKHPIRAFAVLVTFSAFAFGVASASADVVQVQGSWTGQPFSNTAHVTMTADLDLDNYAFDLGPAGSYDHAWWYSSGSFTNMTVTVTGSTTPSYNGTFAEDAFGWVRIYSSDASPSAALSPGGTAYADLGANYNVDYAPSDSGIGALQLGAVNAPGGEHVASEVFSAAVPEPAAAGLLLLTGLPLLLARRRRAA